MTDFSGLGGLVDGRVLLPGDPGYTEGSQPVNRRYAGVRPAAVLAAASAADVAAGITWARENGVPVVARGGGHSYAGNSVNTGLVLDLRAIDRVSVDADTGLVTVGGGTRMGALYAALRAHDLAVPLGNSDDVAVGGLTLGGGVAAVSRAFGLTCDSLVETEVVLADGSTVTCDENRAADLFWACRGGGGGNFGVNTSFTFQARPTRPASTCLVLWDWAHAHEVVVALQEAVRAAPDEFAARIGVSRAPGSEPVVSVIGQHLGPASELREFLAPALAVARPSRMDIADRTYWEAKDYLRHESAGGMFAVRTRCTPKPLSDAGVTTMLSAVDKWPGSGNPDGGGVALFTWGGAITRVPVHATAFPHRDTLFLVSMDTSWTAEDGPGVERDNLAWLAALHEDMGEHAGEGSYLNFTDPDLPGWRSAYHGPNHDRLVEVKRRYDPDRVFTFGQAV
ncbi:FAD-binding oxidoreductase [Actinokineospora fastidiosa]|uniref:FAD-linked oxidoreductase YgaK n=1 Tax=Actinokineospora fastidiosa TaxID=1816 RepID=A0A918GIS4_9PSEU|nr:FAD-binding oxidoreductase [Actinokineospora fastidiosa]GGS35387.1 putative FAD-linked oxidoreductase YgaK [Actinokineospora fastidiosa]